MSAPKTFHTADRFLAAFFLTKGVRWTKVEWRRTGNKPLLHFHFPKSHADVLEKQWYAGGSVNALDYTIRFEEVCLTIQQAGGRDGSTRHD